MKEKDMIGWEMLLRLLLEDIEAAKAEDSECEHCGVSVEAPESGYLLDEIDKNFEGKATNGWGVEIDFDTINMLKEYNEIMDMERRLDKERRKAENIDE